MSESSPALSAEAATHLAAMQAQLQARIQAAGGWLPFDAYMHQALYAPKLGYYVAGLRKFGEGGDFITAPELGNLFAGCIARQCREVLTETGGNILEFGAGSGALAEGVLTTLAELEALPERYEILEVSPDLRAVQHATLRAALGKDVARVHWRESLPDDFTGVVLANEVLDAMPVKRFRYMSDECVEELGVCWDEGLQECARPAPDVLRQRVLALKGSMAWGAGYTSELAEHAEAWLRSVAACLHRGAVLVMDYGFPQHEYYHPDRATGTLMCHYQHRAHPDALWLPSLQDITAHVNFSQIAEVGEAAGLQLAGFTHQAAFLLNLGILDQLPLTGDAGAQMTLANEIKKLTLPYEMGELFKVIAFTRGAADQTKDGVASSARLTGFLANDQRHRL